MLHLLSDSLFVCACLELFHFFFDAPVTPLMFGFLGAGISMPTALWSCLLNSLSMSGLSFSAACSSSSFFSISSTSRDCSRESAPVALPSSAVCPSAPGFSFSRSALSSLCEEIRNGNFENVRFLIEIQPNLAFDTDDNAVFLIHWAVSWGHEEIVLYLLEKGANVNARASIGWTPLYAAGLESQSRIANLPIENGADINAKDIRDETPLHWAALFGSVEMAAYLKKADVNEINVYGETPLYNAVKRNRKDIVSLLIEKMCA
jgi:ankyrin repeat protein